MKFYERIVITDYVFFLEVLFQPSYISLHYVSLKTVALLQSINSFLDVAKGYGLLYLLLDPFYLIRFYRPINVLGGISDQLINLFLELIISKDTIPKEGCKC